MNKKLLKELILLSYKNGDLDNKTVSEIAEKLDRVQLKQYIKALKSAEKLRNVYVDSPFGLQNDTLKELNDIFPNKNIIARKDEGLLLGTRITYNDDVFQMNLKNSLEQIVDNIEDYD